MHHVHQVHDACFSWCVRPIILSTCKIDQAAHYHVPDDPMLPFPQIISLQQKYTYHVLDVHDVKSLQQFLLSVLPSFKENLNQV